MLKITIGITGHRNLTAKQGEKLMPELIATLQSIIGFQPGGAPLKIVALTALAEGADTLFAEAALAINMYVKLILPFEKEQYLDTFSSDEKRAVFNQIYDRTSERHVLNHYDATNINQLYLLVGQAIVDESDYLIAVWNERKARGTGGTAEIVDYAIHKQKKVLLINPEKEPIIAKQL